MGVERIGVVGNGWVGKSMVELFPEACVYDEPQIKERYPDIMEGVHRYETAIALGRRAVNNAEVTFIAVPSPNRPDGSLDSSIVEEVVDWCESDVLVIRSTLNPGDADRMKQKTGKRIVTQPEFLGETVNHPLLDQGDRAFMILGGDPQDRRKVIETYQGAYNANISIRQTTNLEAEVIKLSENRAIGWKVMQCLELYEACEAAGVDYYTVRDAVYGDDPRFNMWFSFVYPENKGFHSSKCLRKDIPAWNAWAEGAGINPELTKLLVERSAGYEKDKAN